MRSRQVTGLAPLEVFFDVAEGEDVRLPAALQEIYGRLSFPTGESGPHVVANFVESLDGVVSLGIPGKAGGGPISGSNQHDRFVMGLLRSVAEAVVVGAGTLRSVPHHIWTPDYIYPPLAAEFAGLRAQRGKPPYPLNVIVSASGDLAADFAIFSQSGVPAHVLTTAHGAGKMGGPLQHVARTAVTGGGTILAGDIIRALGDIGVSGLILLEAGPQLMGQFVAQRAVDELFLTLSPQLAGRDAATNRPGLVSRQLFAPDDPRWAELISLRRGDNHLFLRYRFA